MLNDVDIGDIDPVWLGSKGDKFYRKGNFCFAINAYSEALKDDVTIVHTLVNQAVCYLHIREGAINDQNVNRSWKSLLAPD